MPSLEKPSTFETSIKHEAESANASPDLTNEDLERQYERGYEDARREFEYNFDIAIQEHEAELKPARHEHEAELRAKQQEITDLKLQLREW